MLLALALWFGRIPPVVDEIAVRETDDATLSAGAAVVDLSSAVVSPVTIDGGAESAAVAGEAEAPEVGKSPDYCAELSQKLEENPGASIAFFNNDDGDEAESNRACGLALQLFRRDGVPALPGIAGFEVRDFGDFVRLNPRKRLFDESDDPEWSRPTENRIYNELQRLVDFPVVTLHVVCRSSTCGLVYSFPSSNLRGDNYNYYAEQLADALGFSGFHGGVTKPLNGIWYTYIYLGDWATKREEIPDATVQAVSGISN